MLKTQYIKHICGKHFFFKLSNKYLYFGMKKRITCFINYDKIPLGEVGHFYSPPYSNFLFMNMIKALLNQNRIISLKLTCYLLHCISCNRFIYLKECFKALKISYFKRQSFVTYLKFMNIK